MNITIHRGTNEIGGSCVEIENEGTRILLDAGLPLDDSPASLPDDINTFDSLLISHGHQDHYGLIDKLPESVPLYMGKVAWDFAQSLRLFTSQGPILTRNYTPLHAGKQIKIGSLRVTPFLVDHSSPEAFGFLVQSKDKAIYYSGDFRTHGRKGKTFDYLCTRLPKELDAILLEGTMVRRSNTKYASEAIVEEGMVEAIRAEQGITFISCSAQNIDRMVTAYRAAKRSGKIFVVDIYSAWILRIAQALSTGGHIPDINWQDIKVLSRNAPASRYYAMVKEHKEFFGNFVQDIYSPNNEITLDTINEAQQHYVVKLSDYWARRLVEQWNPSSATYIYSMWGGYLKKNSQHFNQHAYALSKRDSLNFYEIHTSGHAVLNDLKRLVDAVKPQRVIPIHTEHKEKYNMYFPNITILSDSQTLNL